LLPRCEHWHFQTPHEVQDDYDVAFEHYMGSKKEVAATRMALLKEKRIAELEENPRSPGGASFVESGGALGKAVACRGASSSAAAAARRDEPRRAGATQRAGRTTPDVEFHSGLFHSARASGAAPRALD